MCERYWGKKAKDGQPKQKQKRIVKAMVFPVVMYKSETWTIKMAEH